MAILGDGYPFNDYNFKNTLQLKSIVCRWNKRHLFVYSSWLYLLFYYTFHYEDMYCDYIKFNNIIIVSRHPFQARDYHSIIFPLNIWDIICLIILYGIYDL
ncbi:hypothetical protein U3516DRAFT_750479 [Neocallimastix sp. 'constans']